MNMAKCVGELEWQGIGGDAIKSLTDAEIGDMLAVTVPSLGPSQATLGGGSQPV